MRSKRVLFIQFTNPAAYPPLQHAARILLQAGWSIRFIGTEAQNSSAIRFPDVLEQVTRRQSWVGSGWRQKCAYFWFGIRCVLNALVWRPRWVYASDPLSAPIALALRWLGFKIVYHEHDAPAEQTRMTGWSGLLSRWRLRVAASADLVVVPNAIRLGKLREMAGVSSMHGWHCVWNAPMPDELAAPTDRALGPPLRLHFHGSINALSLPDGLLVAVRETSAFAALSLYGYEVQPGYVESLKARYANAATKFHPACPRSRLLEFSRTADVGVAFFDSTSMDPNQSAMAGASNKVFDYLASGLVVLLIDAPQWREFFHRREHLVCYVPDSDAKTLMAAIEDLAANPGRLARARSDGPELIRGDWNYAQQFAPVLAAMSQ